MSRRSRIGAGGLFWRQFTHGRSASVTVALVVLFVSAIATAAPRALEGMYNQELRHQLSTISGTQRDFIAESLCPPFLGSAGAAESPDLDPEVAEVFGAMDRGVNAIPGRQEAPLVDAFGEGRYVSRTQPQFAVDPKAEPEDPNGRIVFAIDPRVSHVVEVSAGTEPAPFTRSPYTDPAFRRDDIPSGIFPPGQEPLIWPEDAAIDVMMSTESAERMRWDVGTTRILDHPGDFDPLIRLSGTFDAIDAGAAYWQHNPSTLDPLVDDDGNTTPTITGTAYVEPTSIGTLISVIDQLHTTIWYPFVSEDLEVIEASAMLPQLRQFTSMSHSLGTNSATLCDAITLRTEVTGVIETALARAGSTNAVLAMMAAGPLGVSIAVLVLGARLVIERRRPALALATARGASATQVRAVMALEGLLLGLPAAALGILFATILIPARVGADGLAIPIAIGLAPAVMFALAATATGSGRARTDMDPTARGRFRWMLELLVIGIAGVAMFLLFRRGLTTSATSVGVDPLLAATPLLLSLAVCVIVLRIYPYPLLWLAEVQRRRPGLTGYLGAIRAVRDPAAGLAPVLAMVVGVSVAVFSSVILTTLDRGVDAAARATVGADLRVTGPAFTAEQLDDITALDGIEAIAGVDEVGLVALRVESVRTNVRLVVVDFDELGVMRPDLPASMDVTRDGGIPIVISSDLAESLEPSVPLEIEGEPVSVALVADGSGGLVATSNWVLVDAAFAEDLTGSDFRPKVVLASLTQSADVAAITTQLIEIGGTRAVVETPAELSAEIRESPAVVGLQIALLVAIIVAAILTAIAVILTSIVNGRARDRLLTMLKTLGLARRQARAIAAWEVGPIAVTALVAGTLLGLALPFVVLGSVDVRPFVGGGLQPQVAIEPLVLLAVASGFSFVVAVAVLAAVFVARQINPAVALRMGEGG